VKQVTMEVYRQAKEFGGVGDHRWNPESKESADHSIPYVVAATLMDGTVTLKSYDDHHLWNPELRALMQKIEVVENEEFTRLHQQIPVVHRARITVASGNGERIVGESWKSEVDDTPTPEKTDAQIVKKFIGFTDELLGSKNVAALLDELWRLEDVKDVATIPPRFALD
jgi:2-methylcitrate dehydratase